MPSTTESLRHPSVLTRHWGPNLSNAARQLASVVIVTLTAMATHVAAQEKLNMYNWSNYIGPNTVSNFEKESGIKMRYDTFDTNEILHAKLAAGKSGYDIVVPSSHWAVLQFRGGLLKKIDKSKLPNYKNLDPAIMEILSQIDPDNQYLIPWFWGYITVAINTDKVKAALGNTPLPEDPWSLVFDPSYASRLKSCGISYLDSAQDVMEAMLVYLGVNVATASNAEFKRAWTELQKVRPSIGMFSSSGYINDLAAGSICVALGFSSDMNIARNRAIEAKKGQNIEVLISKKGAMLFYDTMAIPADAKNFDNAYKFINYRLRPEVAAEDTNEVFYPSPVMGTERFIKPQIASNKTILLGKEDLARMRAPRSYNNDQRRQITRSYTAFKTSL